MPSKIGEYTVTKTLGRGVTSVVKLATDPQGKNWAIKIFEKNNPRVNESLLKALKAEVDVLKNLQHDNIVNMKEFKEEGVWEKTSGNRAISYIVLELVGGGELFDFVATGGALSEEICRYYFRQMLSGLHYLHSQGVTHRDLKPENMLIDDQFNLKIADFGFAAPIEGRTGTGELLTKLGTESYMAPEIHQKLPYQGQTVDLFATGIILFIMISGHPPFTQAMPNDRFYKFISGNRADVFWRSHTRNKKGGFSPEFQSLITSMLQVIPSQRLTMADIVGHPWMQGKIATEEEVNAEFNGRNEKIKAEKAAEQAEKDLLRQNAIQNRVAGAHRAVGGGNVVMMSAGETGSESNAEFRKLGKYNEKCHKNTEFFSKYPADMIFAAIQTQLYQDENVGKDNVKQDASKWKMSVNIKSGVTVPEEDQIQEAEEENKQEEEVEVTLETQMTIKLLQVNEDKLAVEFSHSGGSKQFFYEQYNALLNKVDELNDTL